MSTMTQHALSIDQFPKLALSRTKGPKYQQLVDLIQDFIASGRIEIGSDLPKEVELEQHLGVSLITVRRALHELEDLGLIQKRSAKPAKVTARSPTVRAGRKFDTYQDLTDFTRGARLVIESYGTIKGALIEKHFGLAKGEVGYCLRGHLAVGDQPRTIITTLFPADIGSRLSIKDFSDVLIFQNVQRVLGIKIDRVLATLRADIASKSVASALRIDTGSALMTNELVYVTDDQRIVEVTITNTPSEHFMLSYNIPLGE
jgi:GntR family transcriptional regulator